MSDCHNQLFMKYFSRSKHYGTKHLLNSWLIWETKGVQVIPFLSVFYGTLNLANPHYTPIYFINKLSKLRAFSKKNCDSIFGISTMVHTILFNQTILTSQNKQQINATNKRIWKVILFLSSSLWVLLLY